MKRSPSVFRHPHLTPKTDLNRVPQPHPTAPKHDKPAVTNVLPAIGRFPSGLRLVAATVPPGTPPAAHRSIGPIIHALDIVSGIYYLCRKRPITMFTTRARTAKPSRTSKRRLTYLFILAVGLGFFCSCQSSRNLCPAYDQHYRRETLPY